MGRSDLSLFAHFRKLCECSLFKKKRKEFLWNEGHLRLHVTRPKSPSNHLWQTYFEPPWHEDSPRTAFYIPYLMGITYSKIRVTGMRELFFGLLFCLFLRLRVKFIWWIKRLSEFAFVACQANHADFGGEIIKFALWINWIVLGLEH